MYFPVDAVMSVASGVGLGIHKNQCLFLMCVCSNCDAWPYSGQLIVKHLLVILVPRLGWNQPGPPPSRANSRK